MTVNLFLYPYCKPFTTTSLSFHKMFLIHSLGNQKHTAHSHEFEHVGPCGANMHENPTIRRHKNFILPPEGLRTTVESWEEAYRTFRWFAWVWE